MSKYIDLDDTIHIFAEEYDKHDPHYTSGEYIRKGLFLAKELIRLMPAADVAEVVHGKWLENDGRCYCNRCFEFSCTVMDDTGTIYNDLTKFCPNCGAKMDGGRKES